MLESHRGQATHSCDEAAVRGCGDRHTATETGIPLLYWHEEVVRDFGVVFFQVTEILCADRSTPTQHNAREIEAGDAREPACSS